MLRAKHADRNGDAIEAAELLRLAELLDARRDPTVEVPKVFTRPREDA
ncbi:hypothetical protein ACFVP3_23780 [Streptomyces sp. NPDC057806]